MIRAALLAVLGPLTASLCLVAVLSGLPPLAALAAAALLIAVLVFWLLPWAVLPVAVLGGTLGPAAVGLTGVKAVVAAHLAVLLVGTVALLGRRLAGREPGRPLVLRDLGMVALLAAVGGGALYGLAVGNAPGEVLVAAYLIGIVPAYFLLTGLSLDTPERRRSAGVLFTVVVFGLTCVSFALPGRHGGLLALLPIPTLVLVAGREAGWRRWTAAVVAVVLAADVILASFRGVWLAAAVALVIMLVRGGATVRRGLGAIAACAAALLVVYLAAGGLPGRAPAVLDAFQRSAGYRWPEAQVGLRAFARNPLLGAGLGQQTPQVDLPGFEITAVGPAYHAFYVVLLANLGLVGLCLLLGPILLIVGRALRYGQGAALAHAALTVGFLGAAAVAGPEDGHWELGLLPALALLGLPERATAPGTDLDARSGRRRPVDAAVTS